MTDWLLATLLVYGALALLPVIAGAAVGLPLPASLLLLAAGAFAGAGELGLVSLLLAAFVGAVAGDGLGYWLGRRGGPAAVQRWGGRFNLDGAVIARAERGLDRWGGLSILLTRFLLTPLGPVINILAGAARYPLRSFLLYDLLGEAIWVGSYVGLGYAFSANWDVLADFLGSGTRLVSLLVVVVVLGWLLLRALRYTGRERGEPIGAAPPARAGEPGVVGQAGGGDE
jgi:membrane protein DedA with SNARE-associated domain